MANLFSEYPIQLAGTSGNAFDEMFPADPHYQGQVHPLPLDAVPRVISTQQWDHIERGVKQRVQALEAFLADAYGPLEVVKDGIIPASVIASGVGYYREASSIPSPNG